MELQQLIYFAEIAKLQNITKAANQLYISQPALSKSMRHLEEELDVPLFVRQGKNIYLTSSGELFYQRVQGILADIQSAKRQMQEFNQNADVSVRLKIRALSGIMPEILNQFLKLHPQIRFSLQHGGELAVTETDYDFIIRSVPTEDEARNKALLLREDICLIVPEAHPLAKEKSCTFSQLSEFPLIHPAKNCYFSDTLSSIFSANGYHPDIQISCDEPNTIINLVRQNFGISFMSEYSISPSMQKGIKLIPMSEADFTRDVYLIWPDGAYMPQAAQYFKKFILKYCAEQYGTALK